MLSKENVVAMYSLIYDEVGAAKAQVDCRKRRVLSGYAARRHIHTIRLRSNPKDHFVRAQIAAKRWLRAIERETGNRCFLWELEFSGYSAKRR
jgi:hypothetical protein